MPSQPHVEATLLQRPVDPRTLKNGIYIAESPSQAYFDLKVLSSDPAVTVLGEGPLPEGQRYITVRVDGIPRAEIVSNPAEGKVSIGREFFVTALKDYENWKEKWWREAVQNSVDAGASEIELGCIENDDGTVTVWCEDDGKGMDKDVILNKFLVLGGTTKTLTSGTAGGFGKAKELLILPWLSWKIHSRSTVVDGSGINYVVDTAEYLHGTRLEVVMSQDQCTNHAAAISFVSKCTLPDIEFLIRYKNPETGQREIKRMQANFNTGKPIRVLDDKAEVYYNKDTRVSSSSSRAIVRVNGLFMYEVYMNESIPGSVSVELLGPSISLLTANRDGIRDYQLKRSIESLLQEIAADTSSALKAEKGLIRKKYQGTGRFKAESEAAKKDLLLATGESAAREIARGGEEGNSMSDRLISEVVQVIQSYQPSDKDGPVVGFSKLSAISPEIAKEMLDQLHLSGVEHFENAMKQLVWRPDFYVVNEIEGFKVPSSYMPENMRSLVLKLAKAWAELVRFVFVQLNTDVEFGVGFIFSESTLAEYLYEDGKHWILLNPLKAKDSWSSKTQKNWSASQDDDLKVLYALAIHEATHCANGIDWHNETFAYAMTMNMAKCADGWRRVRAIVKAALRIKGGPEAD